MPVGPSAASADAAAFAAMPASDEAAVWAYRLILGREPDSDAMIRDHVRDGRTLAGLRARFFNSSEFTERYHPVGPECVRNVAAFPPCPIETRVDPATAQKLFAHVTQAWQSLGENEPYWSVVSEPRYRMDRFEDARGAFIDSGRENLDRLLATLKRNGVAADPAWQVLELGCGVGRTTRWLAPQFRRVVALDVSAAHLRLAQQLNAGVPDADRIEWVRLNAPAELAALPEFDLFFSVIVLQHNPPPMIGALLEAVAERLRPGGYAFFQVPTYQRGYSFDVASYLALREGRPGIEMHVFPQSEVFRIFRERGCVLLEVFEDGLSGHRDNHRSNTFLFHKPPDGASTSASLARSEAYARKLESEIARMDAAARREHAAADAALADAARYAASLEAERAGLQRALARRAGADPSPSRSE